MRFCQEQVHVQAILSYCPISIMQHLQLSLNPQDFLHKNLWVLEVWGCLIHGEGDRRVAQEIGTVDIHVMCSAP